MWFGEKHREALATLKYGILDNKGFLLLTGDVGTGKTTLINALIQSLSEDVICTSVPDPGLEKLDFFNYIAAAFGIQQEFSTKGAFLVHFRKFLIEASENNKKVLLIIDEAQLLTQEMLEETRLLSNIEKTDAKLINIFFIGQNEFNEILNREQNRAVRQRLTLNYNIDPLTPDETGEYIRHRLSVAGAEYDIFDESATQEVFMYSGGFPRRINVICDHCLLSGYVKEQKIIDGAIVKECAKELKIPAHIQNRDINGFANYDERSIPVVRPQPPPRPEHGDERPQKKGASFFLTAIICLLVLLFSWFLMFPDHYRASVSRFNKKAGDIKYKVLQILPENFSFFLQGQAEPTAGKKEEQITKEIIEQGVATKRIDLESMDEPMVIGEIHPIQEEIQKEKEGGGVAFEEQKMDVEKAPEKQQIMEDTKISASAVKNLQEHLSAPDQPKEPVLERMPLPEEKIVIRFKYNTNDFTEEGFKKLISFADILVKYPETRILISGYTDSEGYQKYNRKLSEFRANIVRSFFLGRGIKTDQVDIQGLGSQNPIENNDTAWGRMMNRRVEIEIIKNS